jgi:hypothetical protein
VLSTVCVLVFQLLIFMIDIGVKFGACVVRSVPCKSAFFYLPPHAFCELSLKVRVLPLHAFYCATLFLTA